MTIREVFVLILVILAGGGLGAFFFAGLWWTVNKSVETGKQGVVLVLSFLLRVTLALAAFFLIGRWHPDRMGACLIGFIIGRGLLMHMVCAQRKRSLLALPIPMQREQSGDASPTSHGSGEASPYPSPGSDGEHRCT